MGNYTRLKNIITAAINSNGNQEITGQSLQDTLLSIISSIGVNASYGGIATVSTNPTAVDQNVFYLAFESGTYTNFNNLVLDADSWGIFSYYGTWELYKVPNFQVEQVRSQNTNTSPSSKLFDDELTELNSDLVQVRSELNNSHDQIANLQSEKEDKASKQIISDIEYNALVASGEILPDVLYYTYEA